YFEDNFTEAKAAKHGEAEVILYRHPLVSAVYAYWEKCDEDKAFAANDSLVQWHDFWQEQCTAFKKFFATYLKPGAQPNRFLLETDRYFQGPFKPLCELIAFFNPDEKPDIY